MSQNSVGNYVTLPRTDLKVSRICLGTWQFNAGADDMTWNKQEEATSSAIVHEALKQGINFFDTAEAYQNSEKVLGKILQGSGHRSDVVVASKFGQCLKDGRTGYTAADIEQALTKSLEALQTNYIDLYQIHWPICVASMEEAVQQLKLEQSRGRIRYFGYSNFGAQNMTDFEKAGGGAVTNQLPYNLLWRNIEYDVLPKIYDLDMTVLAYSPLQQGLLSGKFHKVEDVPEGRRRTRLFSSGSTGLAKHGEPGQEEETFQAIDGIRKVCQDAGMEMSTAALSWLLEQKNVASVIVGCSTPEQVKENTKVVPLSQDVQRKLAAATEPLKTALGSNTDLWLPAAQSRSK